MRFKTKNIKRTIVVSLILSMFLASCFSLCFSFFSPQANAASAETQPPTTLEELRSCDVSDIALMESYDSRDFGIVTPVKDQGVSNLCWAYAAVSASEVSILRSGIDKSFTKDNLSLSPEALGYSRFYRPKDPLENTQVVNDYEGSNWDMASGNTSYCASIMSQWCGPTNKNQPSNINPFENALFHLNNAVHIKSTQISEIKLAIATYGAVTFSYNNVRETEFYNPTGETSSSTYPHSCTLIGWDDNIPATKFAPNGAKNNGGWLVKNSYTSLPYFWLSYDASSDYVYAFDFTAKQTYENNYFYDYSLTDHLNQTLKIKKACEVFEAKKGTSEKTEYLNAINIGFIGKNVTAKVSIYVDMANESNPESGRLVSEGQSSFSYGGYRTVVLSSPVALENGKKFACVVSVENSDNSAVICNMLGNYGAEAFVYKEYWQSVNYTPRIKAFTTTTQKTEHTSHIWDENIERVEPTCVADGSITKTCLVCGTKSVEILPAAGHDFESEYTVDKQPTYTEKGVKSKHCTRCNEKICVTEIDMLVKNENKISTGMVVGISVGGFIFVLFVVYFVCYFALYRKKKMKSQKFFDLIYKPLNAIFKQKR